MKKNFFFSAAALSAFAVALTACQSEEPAPAPGTSNGEVAGYLAVNITNAGTRAENTSADAEAGEGFEIGVGSENTINNASTRFFFYDVEGKPFTMEGRTNVPDGQSMTSNMVQATSINQNNTDGAATGATGVLVLGKAKGSGFVGTVPAQVLMIANYAQNDEAWADFKNQPLSEVRKKVATLPSEWTSFVMTSSTYKSANDNIISTSNVAECIQTDPEAAKANPVQIYVERLAAKVRVEGLALYQAGKKKDDGTYEAATFDIYDPVTGTATPTELYVELQGWKGQKGVNKAYAIKNIDDINYTWTWNAPNLHRSYWAVCPTDVVISHMDYDLSATTNWLDNFDDKQPSKNIWYCYENTTVPSIAATTTTTALANRNVNATAIVVKGQVQKKVTTDGTDNYVPVDLVKWAGTLYMLDDFKTIVINAYNAANDLTGDKALKSDRVELLLGSNGSQSTVHVITQEAKEAVDDNEAVTKETVEMTQFANVTVWNNGLTSYWVNIKHESDSGTDYYGVVRNHIYDFTLSNVIGLGIPGNNAENPDPEVETFVAAKVNVLNWHVVKNTVVLE